MKKISTFPNETIHIMSGVLCTSMALRIKSYILTDLSNETKFHNCTYWSTNDIPSHHLPCQVNNHHINNKNLILTSHVKINS